MNVQCKASIGGSYRWGEGDELAFVRDPILPDDILPPELDGSDETFRGIHGDANIVGQCASGGGGHRRAQVMPGEQSAIVVFSPSLGKARRQIGKSLIRCYGRGAILKSYVKNEFTASSAPATRFLVAGLVVGEAHDRKG